MQPTLNTERCTIALVALVLTMAGCGRNNEECARTNESEHARKEELAIDRPDHYYEIYLASDINTARESLLKAVSSIDNDKSTEAQQVRIRSHQLWGLYGRLASLELYAGNSATAHLYITEAQFWRIGELKTSGSTDEELAATSLWSETSILDFVSKFDSSKNDGKGPQYRRTHGSPAGQRAPGARSGDTQRN